MQVGAKVRLVDEYVFNLRLLINAEINISIARTVELFEAVMDSLCV